MIVLISKELLFWINQCLDHTGCVRILVPIYNSPNLEQTMKEANIPIVKKSEYIQIFPTNHGDLDIDKAKELLVSLKTLQTFKYEYLS